MRDGGVDVAIGRVKDGSHLPFLTFYWRWGLLGGYEKWMAGRSPPSSYWSEPCSLVGKCVERPSEGRAARWRSQPGSSLVTIIAARNIASDPFTLGAMVSVLQGTLYNLFGRKA